MSHTKAEREAFDKQWLGERIPHVWSTDDPSHCTHCGRKYGPQAAKQAICPKRNIAPNSVSKRLACNIYMQQAPVARGQTLERQITSCSANFEAASCEIRFPTSPCVHRPAASCKAHL